MSDFSKSDQWVGRNISCLIKLGWTDEEVTSRAEKMANVLRNIVDFSNY
jgi:8-amino-3,8-dideoxy-alpha-D-manno-octulosonate transaminase